MMLLSLCKQLMQFCSDPITAECCLLNGADVEKVQYYVVREAWIDMRKDD